MSGVARRPRAELIELPEGRTGGRTGGESMAKKSKEAFDPERAKSMTADEIAEYMTPR